MSRAIILSFVVLVSACGKTPLVASGHGKNTPPQTDPGGGTPRTPVVPAAKLLRTDLYGDPLPDGAIARLGTVRFRHGWIPFNRILTFSPDGRVLACGGGYGKSICLFDPATGRELRRVGPPNRPGDRPAPTLAFSPDGKMLATARNGFAVLYDAATGKAIHHLQANQDAVDAVALSPDGKILATAADNGTLCLWDSGRGREIRRLQEMGERPESIVFSPDGKTLAAVSARKAIALWDVATGKERRRLPLPDETGQITFSPDGKLLASPARDGMIHLWDIATGKRVRTVDSHLKSFAEVSRTAGLAIAFAPGGKTLAAGGYEGTICLLDVATGKEERQFRGQGLEVGSLAFSPDGKKLAAVSLWDAAPHVWDIARGQEIPEQAAHHGSVIRLAPAGDGRSLVSFSLDQHALVWDLKTGRSRKHFLPQLPPRIETISTVALDPRLRLLARRASDQAVALWDLDQGKDVRRLAVNKALGLAFSPDGTVLACACEDMSIRLWDIATGQERHRLDGASGLGRSAVVFAAQLAFTPDGKGLAAPAPDGTLRLWDVKSGKELRRWQAGQTIFSGLVFSPDGTALASVERSGSGPGVRLWEVATGKEVRRLNPQQDCLSIAFSADGRLLALGSNGPDSPSAGDATVRLCETLTGQEVRRLRGHFGGVVCLAFAPDGRTLISGGDDTTLLVWEVAGRRPRGQTPPARLEAAELEQAWTDLGGDAARAQDAVWRLVAVPAQALPLLVKRLRPVAAPDRESIVRLIAELANQRFAVREKATRALEALGELAEPELRKALDGQSLEMQRRFERLLGKCGPRTVPTATQLRALRAVAVLEYLGTPAARNLLEMLAHGAPSAGLTREALAALGRLPQPTEP